MTEILPRVLFCKGDFFEPAPPHPEYGFANSFEPRGRAWFERDPKGFKELHALQGKRLREAFARFCRPVELTPEPGRFDMIYTADASVSLTQAEGENLKSQSVLSRFTNFNRNESEIHREKFAEIDPERIITQSPWALEGTGEAIYDPYRDVFWVGMTDCPSATNAAKGRTDQRAHKFLQETFGVPTIGIKTRGDRYHLDTFFRPLPRGEIVVRTDLFSRDELKDLISIAFEPYDLDARRNLLEVPVIDYENFVTNFQYFGGTVIVPWCSSESHELLRRRRYNVQMLDMSTYEAGGGSVACASNKIDQVRVPGGYFEQGVPEAFFGT